MSVSKQHQQQSQNGLSHLELNISPLQSAIAIFGLTTTATLQRQLLMLAVLQVVVNDVGSSTSSINDVGRSTSSINDVGLSTSSI